MGDITDCYFCGSIDAPLDSHPVVPPETDPPESLQRSVVLCPTCRQKLDRVMDPVRQHLDAGRTADAREESVAVDEPGPGPGADTRSAPGSAVDSAPSSDASPVELPDGTRDVLRLLRNRDFPVERAAIESVAANAYERSRGEIEAALDALVAKGELREADGELYRE